MVYGSSPIAVHGQMEWMKFCNKEKLVKDICRIITNMAYFSSAGNLARMPEILVDTRMR